MRTRLTLLAAFSVAGPTWAQEAGVAAVPPVIEIAPAQVVPGLPRVAAPEVVAPVAHSKETSDVDFPDEEIRVILRNIADLYEMNLVVPDTLQGRTALKLRQVTWRQIFQVILSPVGFTFVEEGNIIKVVAITSLNEAPLATEMIKLNSIKPAVLAEALKGFIDEKAGEKIQAIPETNFIVLTASPTRLAKLRETIETVDKPNSSKALLGENDVRQILIETKFIEVNTGDSRDIGVNWASMKNYEVAASGLKHNHSRGTTGSVTNTGSTGTTSATQNTTDFIFPNGGAPVSNNGFTQTQNTANGVSNTSTKTSSELTTGVFSASDFRLILSALQTDSKSRLISNPTLVTYNGRESTMHVGEEIPVSGGGTATSDGITQKAAAKYEKSGIVLNFVPQIVTVHPEPKEKDYEAIRLDLSKPSTKVKIEGAAGGITLRNKTSDKNVDGTLVPVFSTRSVATEVILKDGYTMGIGGMVESSTSTVKTQVPVLGSIPFLGRLFRNDSKESTNRNLVVFLTAKIVRPSESREQFAKRLRQEDEESKLTDFVARGTIQPGLTKEMQIQRSDMPGFRETQETPFYVPPPPTAKEIKAANKAAAKAKKEADAADKARAEAQSAGATPAP